MNTAIMCALAMTAAHPLTDDCGCDVTDRYQHAYDALLVLDDEESARATRLHLPWGVPEHAPGATNESLLVSDDCVLCYDADLRIPLWGAHRLDHFDVDHDRKRTECFRPDPRLTPDESASCDDYRSSGHDRGHIVPSDAVGRTEASMVNSYILSNMAPQVGRFNRVHWKFLEDEARGWAEERGPVWVIAGCVFDRDNDGARDSDGDAPRMQSARSPGRVAIPSHFYMILTSQRPDGALDTLSLLLVHDAEAVPRSVSGSAQRRAWLAENALVSIDTIESLTGHDFFPARGDDEEALFEHAVAPALW
ncbi:MAG: DNA/RNA non-specific endonuclease [Planctomycetota bacterium]